MAAKFNWEDPFRFDEQLGEDERAVRDAAADSGVGLRELRPAGPTLEDALVDALE